MTQEFVPYEQALELKQLGFEENCFGAYDTQKQFKHCAHYVGWSNKSLEILRQATTSTVHVLAPLYQQAFKWFRDKHKLFASIEYSTTTQKDFVITINKKAINDARDEEYQTYEEAELACLKQLIKLVKPKV